MFAEIDDSSRQNSHKIALYMLDFLAKRSVCGGERSATVDARMIEATLKLHVREMRDRLDRAAGIAKAADACAGAGNIEKAIEVALDVEQLIYEVNTFLNAASLINRISKT